MAYLRSDFALLKEVLEYPGGKLEEEIEAQVEVEEVESEDEMDTEQYVPHTGLPDILEVQEGVNEDTSNEKGDVEKTQAEQDNLANIAKDEVTPRESDQIPEQVTETKVLPQVECTIQTPTDAYFMPFNISGCWQQI